MGTMHSSRPSHQCIGTVQVRSQLVIIVQEYHSERTPKNTPGSPENKKPNKAQEPFAQDFGKAN